MTLTVHLFAPLSIARVYLLLVFTAIAVLLVYTVDFLRLEFFFIPGLKGHFTHMKLFFKITEIETLINITYIVRFLRSTDVSVFYY